MNPTRRDAIMADVNTAQAALEHIRGAVETATASQYRIHPLAAAYLDASEKFLDISVGDPVERAHDIMLNAQDAWAKANFPRYLAMELPPSLPIPVC